VRASSWSPTANLLETQHKVVVPDVVANPSEYPEWPDWASSVKALLPIGNAMTLVGHSSASVVATQLASMVPTARLIIIDGLIPPPSGEVLPVPERLFPLLDSLADQRGMLPPWSQWWVGSPLQDAVGIGLLAKQPKLAVEVQRGLPVMHRSWFNETASLGPWRHIASAYIQLSSLYGASAREAEQLGWPVIRLQGTHLHPVLEPQQTAEAISNAIEALRSAA
jgi:hypothetical protein